MRDAKVAACLRRAGGRLPLVELPALLGVDLVHCERQARALVQASPGDVFEAQGELITQQYFDGLAAEVNEMLQVWAGARRTTSGTAGEGVGGRGSARFARKKMLQVWTDAMRATSGGAGQR
eukprot:200682-Chlamydomonas_euryale.AAC.1